MDASPVAIAIGLGSNVGNREEHLRFGRVNLARRGIHWTSTSAIHETVPVGPVRDQNNFLNQVALGETELSAQTLLEICLEVERERGRRRTIRWGPRVLDLDVLLYGDQRIDTTALMVPHPELARRAFVLVPFAEVAPGWRIPGTELTVANLAAALPTDETEGVTLWRSSATKRRT